MSSSRKSLTATLFSSIFSGGSKVFSRSISSIISWMSWFRRSISSSALSLSSSLVLTAFWRDCRSFCSASSCLMRCSRCLRSDSKSERMCRRDLRSASSCFCSAALSLPSAASWSCSCFTCFSPCTIFSWVSLCARFSASSFSLVSPWDLASLSSSDLSCSMEFRRASSCVRRSCRLRLNCDCSAVCCRRMSSICRIMDRRSSSAASSCCSCFARLASLCCSSDCSESMSDLLRLNWCCSASRFCPSPSS
mmetsp:Transcript_10151/g.44151  ORF Transcript_10151/g.44151 Transcript_10151/m.44151 type:complete len:250 (-) Transcript_10151:1015-1764(-)